MLDVRDDSETERADEGTAEQKTQHRGPARNLAHQRHGEHRREEKPKHVRHAGLFGLVRGVRGELAFTRGNDSFDELGRSYADLLRICLDLAARLDDGGADSGANRLAHGHRKHQRGGTEKEHRDERFLQRGGLGAILALRGREITRGEKLARFFRRRSVVGVVFPFLLRRRALLRQLLRRRGVDVGLNVSLALRFLLVDLDDLDAFHFCVGGDAVDERLLLGTLLLERRQQLANGDHGLHLDGDLLHRRVGVFVRGERQLLGALRRLHGFLGERFAPLEFRMHLFATKVCRLILLRHAHEGVAKRQIILFPPRFGQDAELTRRRLGLALLARAFKDDLI